MGLSVRVAHLQVGELLSYEGCLWVVLWLQHLSHFVPAFLEIRVFGEWQLFIPQFVVFLHTVVVEIKVGENHRNQGLALHLENVVGKSNLSIKCLVDSFDEFFCMCFLFGFALLPVRLRSSLRFFLSSASLERSAQCRISSAAHSVGSLSACCRSH